MQREEPAWKENGSVFISSVTRLLERLLDYRSVIQGDENRDKRMSCTVNLLVLLHFLFVLICHTIICINKYITALMNNVCVTKYSHRSCHECYRRIQPCDFLTTDGLKHCHCDVYGFKSVEPPLTSYQLKSR